MGKHDMYPLYTGFLTKSPPDRKVTGNFKRWMKRWFVLWEDKTLEYYQDRGDPKPKKTIDLSRCDFLDSNLSAKRFENIFSIRIRGTDKTSARTYYLAAETPYEMAEWVDQICKLCEFKASEKNNNADTTVRHELAPLDKEVTSVGRKERDSGIIVPDNVPGDLVQVKVVRPSAYDEVPPPRPIKNESQSAYDYPSQHRERNLSRKSPAGYSNSCPLDASSSSESSLSSFNKRSSCESEHSDSDPFRSPESIGASSDMRRCSDDNYDYPPQAPLQPYDVPSNIQQQQPYDLLPQEHYPHADYDVPPLQNIPSNLQQHYDVPPNKQHEYDVLPHQQGYPEPNYDVPPTSGDDDLHSEEEKQIYDVPPQPTYDTVPAPVVATRSNTMSLRNGITGVPGMVQQFPTRRAQPYDHLSPNVPPGLQYTDYNLLPSNTERSIYDRVPLRSQEQPTYDTVSQGLPSGDTSSNYDEVPAPVPRHTNHLLKPYVNLSFPIDQGYKKPLPNPPQQRDSGTELDEEAVYDVPPVQLGQPAPSVDRASKPGTSVAPKVDRCLKPNKILRDYVNLDPKEMRRATVKEGRSTRTGVTVQRSKSAAADFEADGYLYMESPKRTESSLRYSSNDRKSSLNEEDENQRDEYMYMERNGHDMSYQNYDIPSQYANERKPPSPERAPLRGHYQDIAVVCQREGPSVPERSPRTQYTTIDVEKTIGFRKTCEDVGKGQ